jgi:hypothetical protein
MGTVFLKYEAEAGRYFQFFWSEDGIDWVPFKAGADYTVDGTFVAQWGYSPRAGFMMDGLAGSVHSYSQLRVDYNNNRGR